jgi:hypothetical protein
LPLGQNVLYLKRVIEMGVEATPNKSIDRAIALAGLAITLAGLIFTIVSRPDISHPASESAKAPAQQPVVVNSLTPTPTLVTPSPIQPTTPQNLAAVAQPKQSQPAIDRQPEEEGEGEPVNEEPEMVPLTISFEPTRLELDFGESSTSTVYIQRPDVTVMVPANPEPEDDGEDPEPYN